MTTLRVEIAVCLDAELGAVAAVGATEGGERFGWLGLRNSEPAAGLSVEVPSAQLLPLEAGVPAQEALRILRFWPAWRIAGAAKLELGTRLLVLGDGPLAEAVTRVARLRGAVVTSSTDSSRTGPPAWDGVILTSCDEKLLSAGMRASRTGGTLVVGAGLTPEIDLDLYADAHRRGLTVSGVDPYAVTNRARSTWLVYARAVRRLRPWDAPEQ